MRTTLPIGIATGSIVHTPQKVTMLGITPVIALTAVSGLQLPFQQL
ncbi:hypothetical protein [Brevibacterium album]|nr:hypothetical protein [Brevibacterium album]